MVKYEVSLIVDSVETKFVGSSLKSLAAQAVSFIEDNCPTATLAIKHLKSQRFFFRVGPMDNRIECSLTQI